VNVISIIEVGVVLVGAGIPGMDGLVFVGECRSDWYWWKKVWESDLCKSHS